MLLETKPGSNWQMGGRLFERDVLVGGPTCQAPAGSTWTVLRCSQRVNSRLSEEHMPDATHSLAGWPHPLLIVQAWPGPSLTH